MRMGGSGSDLAKLVSRNPRLEGTKNATVSCRDREDNRCSVLDAWFDQRDVRYSDE
jgi:hypothetical protein